MTPGSGFTEFLAVTAARRNFDLSAPDTVRISAVAPEIAEHPAGKVNDASATAEVQENHCFE